MRMDVESNEHKKEKSLFTLELTKSQGIIAFIKKLILNVDILHFSK
jgi:hypothetical protein